MNDSAANKFLVGTVGTGDVVILNLPLQARSAQQPSTAVDFVGPNGQIQHLAGADPVGWRWPATAPLSRGEALNLAAWLVAVADVDGNRFADLLIRVQEEADKSKRAHLK